MSLLDTVREACSGGYWSRGVKFARDNGVIKKSITADEMVLQVLVPGGTLPFEVHLWPEEGEWDCNCPGTQEACAHVAAAVIAWSKSERDGIPLPMSGAETGSGPAALRYRLEKNDRGFTIARLKVLNGTESPVLGALQGRAGRAAGPLLTSQADLAVEQAVQYGFGQTVNRERVTRLLTALADCSDVWLDGQSVQASGDPVVPIAWVEDDPTQKGGFRVRIVRDPGITEVFQNSSVLCSGVLRPVGSGGLSTEHRTVLGRGLHYGPDEVGTLVSEILPRLKSLIPLDVKTKRLPTGVVEPPRVEVLTSGSQEVLEVAIHVVYGDPPTAKVVRGKLELLGGQVPIRNLRMEARLIRDTTAQLGFPVGLEATLQGVEAVQFLSRIERTKIKVRGSAAKRFRKAAEFVPKVEVDSETGKMEVDFGGADPKRVMDAWTRGQSMVPIKDGWAPLPVDWLEQYGHLVADLLEARDREGVVAPYAAFDLARLCKVLDQPPPPMLEGLRTLVDGFEGISQAELPEDLCGDLREYQQSGVDWLVFLRETKLGGILADDMGLGKTVQALCAMKGRSLVVAPTSVLRNWESEANRFRPMLKVQVYHGAGRALDKTADLTITSYALLRRDVDKLKKVVWNTVILDEAQSIKNPESQVSQAAYQLNGECRLTLTGTPIENRLDELWSQFHFLNPGFLSGRRDFQERYAKPIAMGDHQVAKRLRDRIGPFVLRRLKSEVAPELPPRTDIELRCTLSDEERQIYDAVRASTYKTVVEQLGKGSVMAALEALLRLRQASCHTGLLPGCEAETSSKVDLLIRTLTQLIASNHKSLVFSQWTGLLDRIEPHLRAGGIPFVRLDGSTRDRAGVVAEFQDPNGPPVFLVSLKAGGTGLNLTAADHVFLMDPWWNPAAEDQAADRAHRIGQDKPVMVMKLVAEETVEERILELQERKRAVAEAALGSGGNMGAAGGITKKDLLALLA